MAILDRVSALAKRFRSLGNRAGLACVAIALAHAFLGVVYSLSTPLWESYDETGHYAYARYLALNNRLPARDQVLARWDESHQPPLYYWLASLPIRLVDVSDDAQPRYAVPGAVYVVPDPALDAFPYRGTALAFRAARMVSVVLGTLTIVLTYLSARALFPERPGFALLAMLLHGMWPLLLFVGGVVSNDVAISFFGSLALWLAARVMRLSIGASPLFGYLGLATAVACAVATKDTGLAIMVFAIVIVIVDTGRRIPKEGWRSVLNSVLGFGVVLAAFVAFGAIVTDGRTIRQFTTATQLATSLTSQGILANTAGWRGLESFVPIYFDWLWRLTFNTLFGSFGWGLVLMPGMWYDMALGAGIVIAASVLWAARTLKHLRVLALLGFFVLCVAAAPLARTISSGNLSLVTGRFFLPIVGALCLGAGLGLAALPRRLGRGLSLGAVAGLSMIAILTPSVVIQPFYRRPVLLDPVSPPAAMSRQLGLRFGGVIELLGYSLPNKAWQGEYTHITLFWRALKSIGKDYGLRVEMYALDGNSFENGVAVTPGRQVFPTGFWQPGDTFAETYTFWVAPTSPAPTQAQFGVIWYEMGGDTLESALTPECATGQPCDFKFGALPVGLSRRSTMGPPGAAPVFKASMAAGEVMALSASTKDEIRAGEPISLSLLWQVRRSPLPRLTAFVHLVSPDGVVVAQGDSPPREGTYPTTVWSETEYIPDRYAILNTNQPPGEYVIRYGLYDPVSGERAALTDPDGRPLRDNVIDLARVKIR